jgi:hypothetical protein
MQNSSSTDQEREGAGSPAGSSIGLALPIRDSDLFKHSASTHVLNFLSDNPDINVSIRQLSTVTPLSERATREAVNVLEANDIVF